MATILPASAPVAAALVDVFAVDFVDGAVVVERVLVDDALLGCAVVELSALVCEVDELTRDNSEVVAVAVVVVVVEWVLAVVLATAEVVAGVLETGVSGSGVRANVVELGVVAAVVPRPGTVTDPVVAGRPDSVGAVVAVEDVRAFLGSGTPHAARTTAAIPVPPASSTVRRLRCEVTLLL